MKKIPLTQGQFALVDDEDFEWLDQFKWQASWALGILSYVVRRSVYVDDTKRRKTTYMSRTILGLDFGDKLVVDHKNHNTLDNQRHNLRICNHRENVHNHRKYQRDTASSEYHGVVWHKAANKWKSQIKQDSETIYLGLFVLEADAAKAYDRKALELRGEFTSLNFPKKVGV